MKQFFFMIDSTHKKCKGLPTPSASVNIVLEYIVTLGKRSPIHSQASQCIPYSNGNTSIDADACFVYALTMSSSSWDELLNPYMKK